MYIVYLYQTYFGHISHYVQLNRGERAHVTFSLMYFTPNSFLLFRVFQVKVAKDVFTCELKTNHYNIYTILYTEFEYSILFLLLLSGIESVQRLDMRTVGQQTNLRTPNSQA